MVGMSAMAVAIVGGPMTMTFLALESTDNFTITIAVLLASITAAITVRRVFGYSFTTWRFHLRGEAIRSAVDIGWIHSLTVGRMMRRSVPTVQASMSLQAFREEVPLGSSQRVVVLDEAGRYAGIVYPAEAHAAGLEAERVGDLLHHQDQFLTPQMIMKDAIAVFEQAVSDALAVVDGTILAKCLACSPNSMRCGATVRSWSAADGSSRENSAAGMLPRVSEGTFTVCIGRCFSPGLSPNGQEKSALQHREDGCSGGISRAGRENISRASTAVRAKAIPAQGEETGFADSRLPR